MNQDFSLVDNITATWPRERWAWSLDNNTVKGRRDIPNLLANTDRLDQPRVTHLVRTDWGGRPTAVSLVVSAGKKFSWKVASNKLFKSAKPDLKN